MPENFEEMLDDMIDNFKWQANCSSYNYAKAVKTASESRAAVLTYVKALEDERDTYHDALLTIQIDTATQSSFDNIYRVVAEALEKYEEREG